MLLVKITHLMTSITTIQNAIKNLTVYDCDQITSLIESLKDKSRELAHNKSLHGKVLKTELSEQTTLPKKQTTSHPTTPNLLITPCARTKKKLGPCSKTDWEEQILRASRSEQMMWDDGPKNASQPGDIFILCRNNISVAFHRIQKILPPTARLPTWADNVGQTDRNVIYITPELTTMNWDEWLELDGAKKVQGTTAVIQGKTKILNALRSRGVI